MKEFDAIINQVYNFVQAQNADRFWIGEYKRVARMIDPTLQDENALRFMRYGQKIEDAYDNGEGLSTPLPFEALPTLTPDSAYVWKKPILVLANELAGSGGDAFPMLMQRTGTAKIFGQRTMGLGGSVQPVVTTSNSGAQVSLTRGLFTSYRKDGDYGIDQWVENMA